MATVVVRSGARLPTGPAIPTASDLGLDCRIAHDLNIPATEMVDTTYTLWCVVEGNASFFTSPRHPLIHYMHCRVERPD